MIRSTVEEVLESQYFSIEDGLTCDRLSDMVRREDFPVGPSLLKAELVKAVKLIEKLRK